ncbi:1,4-alpha-glucan branching protein [Salinimonas sp. HHU 13199]|uniref:1,4-alpha-glucan branching protein n=1 Tax=Salinimonas profundi TaxID=2729140 RepID=A0ABR8LH62_9ALTE|nr:alpha-amylase family glycosyl hydrolase [Salinimonas profundi]MBD3585595.1 1,4-alpha-glucan branching protein [Salinimonas profundi]
MSAFDGQLGVIPVENGYQFSVWAPNANAVALTGTFNDWEDQPMEPAEGGIWWCVSDAARNGHEYKFVIEDSAGNKSQKNDPRARHLTNSVGNSLIYDDDYQWQTREFQPPALHQHVIYEMHIGTFGKNGDTFGTFDSVISRLDALKKLGITMIELMPVNEFAGDQSWGYNPAYPFAVEEAYGGPDGLKRFIDAAHQRGIGVILDVVYNHLGPSDLDLWQFDGWSENDKGGIYFYNDERSSTPWGDTRPDYGREEVRRYFIDNARMWLSEFRADGLRMDMVPYMRSVSGIDDGSDDIPEAYTMIKQINQMVADEFDNKVTIAEDLHSHHFITDPPPDGCGYTAQWDAGFVHPIREALIATDDSAIDVNAVVTAISHTYSQRPFSRVVYTESHDEVANGRARVVEEVAPGNVDDDFFAHNKAVVAAALVLTSCGIPMVFQGQEFKQHGWFSDDHDIDWERREQFDDIVAAFTALINLRTNENGNSAGLTGAFTEIVHQDDENKVVGFMRTDEHNAQPVWVYISLANRELDNYSLSGLPEKPQCLFAWQHQDVTDTLAVEEGSTTLLPYSILVFGQQ